MGKELFQEIFSLGANRAISFDNGIYGQNENIFHPIFEERNNGLRKTYQEIRNYQ